MDDASHPKSKGYPGLIMRIGYVMCTTDRSKVLCVEKGSPKINLLDTEKKENLERALCLKSLTSIKSVYLQLKEKKLVDTLDIVDIQELYK